MGAPIDCFEDASRRGAGVIDIRLPRHSGYRRDAIADRTDVSITHRIGVWLLGADQSDAGAKRKTKTKTVEMMEKSRQKAA